MNKISRNATAEQLIPCKVTYQGTDYSPYTHREVIETIGEYLYKNNLKVRDTQYLAASNGQRAIGKVFIDYPDLEQGYMIAWKNSLDGSMSFGLASGAHTFICSNGSVYGDVSSFSTKHRGSANQEIVKQIQFACERLEETMKIQIERREKMKKIELNKRQIAEIAGRLFIKEEIITSTQLGILKKEIENPSFNYKSDNSAWQLYSHATHAIKETTPLNWHKSHKQLGNFFVNEFGLLVTNNELELA